MRAADSHGSLSLKPAKENNVSFWKIISNLQTKSSSVPSPISADLWEKHYSALFWVQWQMKSNMTTDKVMHIETKNPNL